MVYVEDGELVYLDNGFGEINMVSGGQLPAGEREIIVRTSVTDDRTRRVELLIDGNVVAQGGEYPGFSGIAPFQGIDVGIDRRSPVSWDLHERHGSFAYSGDLRSATWTPGDSSSASGAGLLDMLRQMGAKYD